VICGLETQTFAKCFVEIDEACRALTDRTIAFNAHRAPAPPGAVAYNLENVPLQVTPDAFPDHEVWDFSARNVEAWRAAGREVKHVPVEYHPSMERFKRAAVLDIDVVFCGALNERRVKVLDALRARGLKVVVVPTRFYGRQRDAILARAKLALNMLFYEDGLYPTLRTAHLVANRVPVLSELAPEMPAWSPGGVPWGMLTEIAEAMIGSPADHLEDAACARFDLFKATPLVLP
jgi:hypothetical protein